MFQTNKNANGYSSLNEEEKDMLSRINAYAEKVILIRKKQGSPFSLKN